MVRCSITFRNTSVDVLGCGEMAASTSNVQKGKEKLKQENVNCEEPVALQIRLPYFQT